MPLLNDLHGFRSKLVQEVAILVKLQRLHSSLPAILVGFVLQKDACLGLLEIANGSQLNLNQYIVLGTELTFGSFWRPIIEVLRTFNGSNRVFSEPKPFGIFVRLLPLFKSSNCLGVKANQRRIDSIAVNTQDLEAIFRAI